MNNKVHPGGINFTNSLMQIMIRIGLLITFFLHSNINSWGQSDYQKYHFHKNKASTTDSSDSVKFHYLKAFASATPFAEDAVNFARLLFNVGDTSESKNWLTKAVDLGYQYLPDSTLCKPNLVTIDYSAVNLFLDTITPFGKFSDAYFQNNYRALRNRFLINLPEEDLFEVLLFHEKNYQDIRSSFFASPKRISRLMTPYMQRKLIRPNTELLINLMQCNRFPERRFSKHFNARSIMVMLLHAVSGLNKGKEGELFFELLWQQVVIGNITPWEYASAYDFYLGNVCDLKASKYGTLSENGQLLDLIDPININKLRDEKWLISIDQYCNQFNRKLPANYER